mgnify:CR=1 FL=1
MQHSLNAAFFATEKLETLRQLGSKLQGHPDMRKVPGVDMSTGSPAPAFLLPSAWRSRKKLDKSDRYVYALLGDGEIEEGQVWEAAMAAAHYGLDHMIAFVDHNGLQIDGRTADVMNVDPVDEKFAAFGWDVQVIDGHSFAEIADAIAKAKRATTGKPQMIVMNTTKGKGVFLHGKRSRLAWLCAKCRTGRTGAQRIRGGCVRWKNKQHAKHTVRRWKPSAPPTKTSSSSMPTCRNRPRPTSSRRNFRNAF